MITRLLRSRTCRKPSSSTKPRSPVCRIPSRQRLGGRLVAVPVAEHRAVHAGVLAASSRARRTARRRRPGSSRCGSGRPLPPDRVATVGVVDGHDRRRLAQPVRHQHRLAELLLERGAHRLGAVAAAVPHLVERREVVGCDCVVVRERVDERRRPVPHRDPLVADPLGDPDRVVAVEDDRATRRPAPISQRREHLHVEDGERRGSRPCAATAPSRATAPSIAPGTSRLCWLCVAPFG